MKIKLCKFCKKEFESSFKRRFFCSDKCYDSYQEENNKIRSKLNYKKRIDKLKTKPKEYEKYKLKNKLKAREFRKEIKKDPAKYEKQLQKYKEYRKIWSAKTTKERKSEIWSKAKKKYKATEKGKLAIKRWKKSEKSKLYDKVYGKKYRADPVNKKKIREREREYIRERYKKDIVFRIRVRLSTTMRRAVRSQRTGKSLATSKIVGCDFKFLIKYLESKFKKGMTWDNFEKWHIDHIKPCSSFNLKDPEQQKICFHYTNLQPLWAHENLEKSNKVSERYKNNQNP